jgi:hypothetical protein
VHRAVRNPWLVATGEDLRWPTSGAKATPLLTRISHWYMGHLTALTPRSEKMVKAFLSVVHMIKEPSSLFAPDLAARVLAHALLSSLGISS